MNGQPHEPDSIHHVAICEHCGGLEASILQFVDGVESITIDLFGDGPVTSTGTVYIGPAIEACDKEQP